SPRTENNTYAMLSPALAVFLASAFVLEHRPGQGSLLAAMALLLAGSRIVERLLAPHAEQVWLSPFIAAAFAVYALVRLFADASNPFAREKVSPTGRA
ncbi:MAG TPA: hypothetical protein VF903_03190, partial [Nitrospirota bacterium]